MKTVRKVVFWIHLGAGLLFGAVLAVMVGTGAILAFAPQILSLADGEARFASVPVDAVPQPLTRLADAAKRRMEGRPMMITLFRDPERAAVVNFGRGKFVYVNPCTEEAQVAGSDGLRRFFRTVTMIHRNVGMGRAGFTATRMATLALALLCITGIWLWWPRSWRRKALRASLFPRFALTGRARNWNWHNVAAVWFLPFVAAMTWSGLVLSIRGLGGWLNAAAPLPPIGEVSVGGRPASMDALLASALTVVPDWESAVIRMGGQGQRGPGDAAGKPGLVTVAIEERGFHLLPTEVYLHPVSAEVVSVRRAGDLSLREFLGRANLSIHRGDLLGLFGQTMNFLACLALVLVAFTGYALSWRRFFGKTRRKADPVQGRAL